jgi:hypothetical protein
MLAAVIVVLLVVVTFPVQMREPTKLYFIDNLEEGVPVGRRHWAMLSLVSKGKAPNLIYELK